MRPPQKKKFSRSWTRWNTSTKKRPIQIVIITGLSGSGKSTVLKAFEDLGYFCVDNLPIQLLPSFLEIKEKQSKEGEPQRVALVMDLREETFLEGYRQIFEEVRQQGYHLEIIFLEASDEVLIRRFSQTRRPHPLAFKNPLAEGIRLEREALRDVKEIADVVIDTSHFNVHQLRQEIKRRFGERKDLASLLVHLISFGFKYGVPPEISLLFDVRFLPNPYFEPDLKPLSGLDQKVRDYIFKRDVSLRFLNLCEQFLRFLLPQYIKEDKSYLIIGVGCTGGRHRSVAVAEELSHMVREWGFETLVTHRDLAKEV